MRVTGRCGAQPTDRGGTQCYPSSAMDWQVARVAAPLASLTARPLGAASERDFHDAYVVSEGGEPRWQALAHWGEHRHVPFREELVWPSAGVVAIGGGAAVYLVGLRDGEPRRCFEVPDFFGHLALDSGKPGVRDETLYVLGWFDAYALDPTLGVRWHKRELAVDGLVFSGADGTTVRLGAELDPPGGWFEITLDALTGRELSRRPDFSDGYVGLYGSGRGV